MSDTNNSKKIHLLIVLNKLGMNGKKNSVKNMVSKVKKYQDLKYLNLTTNLLKKLMLKVYHTL
jgi:hypothetical protein